MHLRDYSTASERRKALEATLNISLPHVGMFSLDEKVAGARNCENMIGVVQIPLGIAGPFQLRTNTPAGGQESRTYYVPLATTEGALVASVNRGCKAMLESGGVTVVTKKIGITRAPVFRVKNITEGLAFMKNCEIHIANFQKVAEKTSSHLKLLSLRTWMVGRSVFLRFSYDTQDAMGMNMATIATASIVSHIEEKTGIPCIALSGNMCVDKKPNYLNFLEGRGISIWADAIIKETVIMDLLKTDSQKIIEVWQRKIADGSMLSGTIGANAHAANIIAAIFTATGQDIAHVSECSMGVTSVEKNDDDLYISIYLPDMIVGTVGGGTSLETQKEALAILGIHGGDNGKNAQRLVEIIGATVLAGELSLLASLAEGTLAQSHQKLARGKNNHKSQ